MAPEKGKPKRELVLNKGQEKFIFRYNQGDEDYLSQGDNKHNYMGDETDTTNQTPNPPESYDNS
jgi:hypothetical protein